MKIGDDPNPNSVRVDTSGYLLVKDIEHWLMHLIPIKSIDRDGLVYLVVADPDTKAKFEIRRVE